ncbi:MULTISPECIES: response regulator transcription factor [unclassified Lentimonas]|uniref:response regulator transcription factor n=1 Tax=unclassified Lentimonas TaxID=2630993 RepID=UPI00132565DB|nr:MULTISPECIES: response regulator [unclassified Lentimonas]CAA6678470.1 Chemotaxis regulator - transmits chemoreceptor signals to flagelllar motor components CheY [Lentimonas sp. CC4]CAA6685563.1 Chemotaxis regulator - transmits chemoreceptor signals to flagelllar motor components CheY [Lentimonas sp. CC6]CAA6689692.1 Chemotaxis regulator - transmits chemoreceptor signals to flagelllar motor components CheY [Lentimonas sp. CC19]CAA6690454.1 Chemotaxis regulator - transmits chemoreceptor signa
MSRPYTALIVDDEPHLRMYLKLILKQIRFNEFFEAKNGQEGVDIYKQHKPDLVLLDVNMPVKEGMEALEEILEFDEDAVVVMASSVASRKAVERSVELGASYYIRKDTPKEDIVAQLSALIEDIWE